VHTGHKAKDRTEHGVSRAAMANGLSTDAILLGGEGQGGGSGGQHVIQRAGEDVQSAAANPQTQVLEAKEIVVHSFRAPAYLPGRSKK
jgi:hypothetical protein